MREKNKRVPRHSNRLPEEKEQKILEYCLHEPTHGQVRVANELNRKHGWTLSSGGVRGVWVRHGIQTVPLRLKRLEKWAAENHGILKESQVQALEEKKFKEEAHGEIETHHSGYFLAQDTYYVGTIKGIGRIYQRTGIDT